MQAKNAESHNRVKIEAIYYTDPLCCWSWAMEPSWIKLQEEFKGSMDVTYKMAGLLPSFRYFNDPLNSLRKPIHMGPEWMHVKEATGVDIRHDIWVKDPPASSFPACVAVKCAELQSKHAGVEYLRLAREAVMIKGANIARSEVLLGLASNLEELLKDFNKDEFQNDLLGKRGKNAFRLDWQEVKYLGIRRLPTLVFREKMKQGKGIMLTGFQSYENLLEAVKKIGALNTL
jgi:predicted DsbA family dithiol-disulfide isomerase